MKLKHTVSKIDYFSNVVYKMLEKYHYLKLLKQCKKILDDGQVTDDEIDSLKYVDDD